MKKQTSVEWLIENINKKSWWENVAGIPEEIIEQAKSTEKENMIGLLQWMNKIASETPMRLETDLDDIVEQYYNETYGGNK
jgi:hypothetical protein